MNGPDVEAILAGMNLGDPNGGDGGHEIPVPPLEKKSKKKSIPIETTYEGFIFRRFAPPVGETKTWSKVSVEPMPYDSTRLYKMGVDERKKQKKEIDGMFRSLSTNQQRVVERLIQQKNRQELSNDAIWEPYSIRREEKVVQKGLFSAERVTVAVELIVRRKDKNKGLVNDKPTGTTINPSLYAGEIIDLSKPVKDDWVMIEPNKKKNKEPKNDVVELPRMPPYHPDPARLKWNGFGWEDKTEEELAKERQARNNEAFEREIEEARRRKHVARAIAAEEEQQRAQLRQAAEFHKAEALRHQNMLREQQVMDGMLPQASIGPNAGNRNPFQPMNQHPEQFANDSRDEYNPRYARRGHRSRSGSRHRRPHTPSISSSDADDLHEFSPPQSPEPDYGWGNGGLGRRRTQRYAREMRTQYPDERYDERQVYRRGGPDYFDDRMPRGGPDDFPGAARRPPRQLTDFPQGYENAAWDRPRDGRRRDPLARELRQRRSYEAMPYAGRDNWA